MEQERIYYYAIIHHPTPTKDNKENGRPPRSKLVAGPTAILARDVQEVNIVAARMIPAELTDVLNEVEIAVTPF